MDVGNRIRELRLKARMSQHDLARRSAISQASISDIEAGRQSPTVETLMRICDALGISMAGFFCEDGSRRVPENPPHVRDVAEAARRIGPTASERLARFLEAVGPLPNVVPLRTQASPAMDAVTGMDDDYCGLEDTENFAAHKAGDPSKPISQEGWTVIRQVQEEVRRKHGGQKTGQDEPSNAQNPGEE